MNMNLAIRVMGPSGTTALLTKEQLAVSGKTITAMFAGKISLKLANDILLHNLDEAGMPVNFEEIPT